MVLPRCSVGGIALSSLVPLVVQQLAAMARAPTPDSPSHLWALHSLWLTADAAGLSYTPHVKVGAGVYCCGEGPRFYTLMSGGLRLAQSDR